MEGMKAKSAGKIDLSKPGLGVGGATHGGAVREGKFRTPYPLDNSDHAGPGEHGNSLETKASGAAGGYPASTSRGK